MSWLRRIFSRERIYAELSEEIREHLEEKVGELVSSGMTRKEAERAARREFGNATLVARDSREVWKWPRVEDFFLDVRYAVRTLRKSPSFTAVAVLTLALGIGACSSIFSVVNAVLLRQLLYKNADRLILLWGTGGRTSNRDQISFTDLQDWRANSHSFDEIANFHTYVYTLTGKDGSSRVRALQVSDGYFRVMQSAPLLGRFFGADDLGPGKQPVAVLSYDFWQQKFGGDPNALGKTILLNLRPFVIIGVAPQDLASLPNSVIFRPPSQLYTPVESPYSAQDRTERYLRGIGLLKPGVSLSQAQGELNVLVAEMQKQYPNEDGGRGVRLVTLKDDLVRNIRPTLLILQLAVVMVMLIACANVANLQLARCMARQKEIALRSALGASRSRLMRQVLTESVILALVGGSLGVMLAYWGVGFLKYLGADVVPELAGVSIDIPVLAFTTAVSLIAGVLFRAAPAAQSSALHLANAMKSNIRSLGVSTSQARMRSLLVGVEVALALVLLVSGGLLLKSFVLLQHVDPGFDPNHVSMTFVYPPPLQNASIEQQQAFFRSVVTRISALPGVERASIVSSVPDSGDFDSVKMKIKGRVFSPSQRPAVDRFIVSPGYFSTLRIPLIRGRLFDDTDDPSHPLVVLVNQLLGEQLFPGQNPIGQQIQIPTPGDFTEETEPYRTIVGVVGDVVQNGLASQKTMQVYAPYQQYDCQRSNLLFRTSGDPLQLARTVRAEWHNIDATLIAPEFAAMDKIVAGSIAEQRFSTTLLTIFAVNGLLLAAIGVYGVVSYLVAQRTGEFGIRIALGAASHNILGLVVRQGMRPVVIGAIAGIALCYPATRGIERLLFKTGRFDLLTFAAVFIVLTGSALIASYLPARRATAVDPVVALQHE